MRGYIAPFSLMNDWCLRHTVNTNLQMDASYDDFLDVVKKVIRPVPVDEQWYVAEYPGVARALAAGQFHDASEHYVSHGYFERRLPFAAEREGRRYPTGFGALKSSLTITPTRAGLRVRFERAEFALIIQGLLNGVPVDEAWYRDRYPVIAENLDNEDGESASRDFVTKGYFAGRWPFQFEVDDAWYPRAYPDVEAELKSGKSSSASEHFRVRGYGQGRLPSEF